MEAAPSGQTKSTAAGFVGHDHRRAVSPAIQLGRGYLDANCVTTGQRCSPGWSGVNARLSPATVTRSSSCGRCLRAVRGRPSSSSAESVCRASILKRCAVPWTLLSTVRCHDRRTFGGPARYLVVTTFTGRRRRASHQVTIGGQSPPNALGARNYALQSVVMAGEGGHLGDELATVNPLVEAVSRTSG